MDDNFRVFLIMEKEEANNENDLSNIKETVLIKKLTKSFKVSNKSSTLGIGDDAAVLNFDNQEVVISKICWSKECILI